MSGLIIAFIVKYTQCATCLFCVAHRITIYNTIHGLITAFMEASYRVSLRIAKAKSPHTIGEELIMPCAKEMVSLMIGEDMVSKLGIIPLSNNTVHRRICDMSEDITAQNIAAIEESPWHAMQLDESTDIASCEQLIVWVRFINDGDFVPRGRFLINKSES